VYDPEVLLRFLEEADKQNLRIPVMAGIWPLVSLRNAEFLRNEVPGVVVPDAVMARMERAQLEGKEAAEREGVAIACEVVAAVEEVVAGIQVAAPFGRIRLALEVARALGGRSTPADGTAD
jgi:homocysteine S-methyltransferase